MTTPSLVPFRSFPMLFGGSEVGQGLGRVFARTLIPAGTKIPEQPTNLKHPFSQIVMGPLRLFAII